MESETTPEQMAKNNRAQAIYQATQILGSGYTVEEIIDAAEQIYQYVEKGKPE